MTSLTPELEMLRFRLLEATTRDVARERRRAQRTRTTLLACVAAAVAATGVAGAADNVARFVTSLDVMGVFDRPARQGASDEGAKQMQRLDDMSAAQRATGGPAAADPSPPVDGRVLLRHEANGASVQVYGTPTTDDEVCFTAVVERDGASAGGGGGTCVAAFTAAWPVSGTSFVDGDMPAVLAGIVSDAVRLVRVRTAAGWSDATMGENAYAWTASSSADDPIELEAVLHDGSTRHQQIDVPQTRAMTQQLDNARQGTNP